MSLLSLTSGSVAAVIDTHGAWLTELTDNQQAILTPKATYYTADGSPKERGGCHVCVPNFDSGGTSGLPHHGFGRVMDWQVVEQSDSAVTLQLEHGTGDYEALHSQLSYYLNDDGIRMELTLTNTGSQALPVSPGFHPYYPTAATDKQVLIDKNEYELDNCSAAAILKNTPTELTTNNRTYQLMGENTPFWVLWTDRLGDYVCLEPTAGGMDFAAGTAQQLAADQTLVTAFELHWTV